MLAGGRRVPARRPLPGYGFFVNVCVPGRISAPGPGRPVDELMVNVCVAASQKVATRVPVPVAGYCLLPHAGLAGMAFPVREIAAGKHGVTEELLQQFWLRPPFASTQVPSGVLLEQANPPQAVPQPEPPQLSCSGCPWQGFVPGSVDVPLVSGSLMSRVPANWDEEFEGGGQPAERG